MNNVNHPISPERALLEIVGPDAQDFLNRMSTTNIKTLRRPSVPGASCEARATLFLKGDGRLVASCWIANPAQDLYVISTDGGAKDGLIEHLDRFIIMEKVELRDVSSQWQLVPLLNAESGSNEVGSTYSQDATSRSFNINAAPHVLPRRDIWLPTGTVFRNAGTGETHNASLDADDVKNLEAQRILAREPAWGAELTTNTIPLEAGLKGAIDFAKGCFPGQEIVARIENLGHPANILVGLSSDSELHPGMSLFAEQKQVGRVTSCTQQFRRPLSTALGFVKWDRREPGTRLQAGSETGPDAVVCEWPVDLN